jgi:cell division protein FtsB
MLKRFPVLKNKFVYATLAFLVWLTFFDNNSLITQYKLSSTLNQLKEEKNYYEQEIERNRMEVEKLMTNEENLERFAREKYLMKKKDEDVFILVED